jgi:phenylpyruvate tautomerase PptA (4-oxalocrotonate tautomerase family)
MPFVNIRLVEEVIADDPERKKAAIAKGVVKATTEITGLTNGDVWVVLEEVAARNLYVGPISVDERRTAK